MAARRGRRRMPGGRLNGLIHQSNSWRRSISRLRSDALPLPLQSQREMEQLLNRSTVRVTSALVLLGLATACQQSIPGLIYTMAIGVTIIGWGFAPPPPELVGSYVPLFVLFCICRPGARRRRQANPHAARPEVCWSCAEDGGASQAGVCGWQCTAAAGTGCVGVRLLASQSRDHLAAADPSAAPARPRSTPDHAHHFHRPGLVGNLALAGVAQHGNEVERRRVEPPPPPTPRRPSSQV